MFVKFLDFKHSAACQHACADDSIRRISGEERLMEVARILSGSKVTPGGHRKCEISAG